MPQEFLDGRGFKKIERLTRPPQRRAVRDS